MVCVQWGDDGEFVREWEEKWSEKRSERKKKLRGGSDGVLVSRQINKLLCICSVRVSYAVIFCRFRYIIVSHIYICLSILI